MKSQRVKHTSYLAVVTLDFSDGELSKNAVLLPPYAEVIHISAKVTNAGSGTLDLGFEGDLSSIANNISLSATGVHYANVAFTASDTQEILATASATSDARVELRVQYFTPSEITIEAK